RVLEAATHANQFGHLLPVLSKALAIDREQRFETAAKFHDALANESVRPQRRYAIAVGLLLVVGGMIAPLASAPTAATSVSLTRRQMSAVGRARFPAMSPDGEFVAYMSGTGLYVTEVRTGETRQVATGDGLQGVMWTSGGNEVAFQAM